ncbi:MAG: hypothetical protein PHR35_19830, partial [Kiritimatiellae bacterium]|nr:hypothetical protein [Kiritimatiellia bacterium]
KEFGRPCDVEPLGTLLGLGALRAWRKIRPGAAALKFLSASVRLPRRTDVSERIAALEREQAELLESLRGTTLNFRAFLPLYLAHALHPEFPAAASYLYLNDKRLGRETHAAMDAMTRQLVQKYLGSLRAMESLARIRENIATLRKHAEINRISRARTIAAEIQGLMIGGCAIVTSPAELLVEVGLKLKRASPHRHTWVVAFSNGYLHYGAPAAFYDKGGYEVTECLLAPAWQAIYERQAIAILRRLER